MFNVCPGCGLYTVEKVIDPAGPDAICPECGYRHRFVQLPVFFVTGASGSGKTTVALKLPDLVPEVVVMESDILWGPEFAAPTDDGRRYRDLWLRVAKNISQSGRPVCLIGSAIPEPYEQSPERRYFAASHYLALVCDADVLGRRLEARPEWRQSGHRALVSRMQDFNNWLRSHADATTPPMTLLNTTDSSVEESAEFAATWLKSHLIEAGERRSIKPSREIGRVSE